MHTALGLRSTRRGVLLDGRRGRRSVKRWAGGRPGWSVLDAAGATSRSARSGEETCAFVDRFQIDDDLMRPGAPRRPLCARSTPPVSRPVSYAVTRRAPAKAETIPAHILALQEAERAKQEAARYRRPTWTGTLKAGTPLGFKVYKNEPEPVAREDTDYPDWLWHLLDRPAFDGDPQRPGQVNRRDPVKEIRRQNDRDRSLTRHLARLNSKVS